MYVYPNWTNNLCTFYCYCCKYTFAWKAFNIKILNSMVHLTFISFAATSRFMIVIKTHFDKVGLLDILQYAP